MKKMSIIRAIVLILVVAGIAFVVYKSGSWSGATMSGSSQTQTLLAPTVTNTISGTVTAISGQSTSLKDVKNASVANNGSANRPSVTIAVGPHPPPLNVSPGNPVQS